MSHPLTTQFRDEQRFRLDPFQIAACEALEDGRSVLVAAPTGAGKTIVGEFAVHLAATTPGDKAFYTTPIKALSNQKFRELAERYGEDEVGLLTGDVNINGSARIVVMTTEVLRNMIYAGSRALDGLRYVVMDEVHYLADRFRGAVWEEVIIHLPDSVRLVSLSATVSNAEEFGDWLDTVRGDTEVIVSEHRPVPLEQHVLVRGDLLPLFDEHSAAEKVNRDLLRMRDSGGRAYDRTFDGRRRGGPRGGRGRGGDRGGQARRMPRIDRPEAVDLLDRANLLPAIFFIFSRVGCDSAVQQVRRSGLQLTTREERDEIRRVAHERTAAIADEDFGVLEVDRWIDDLCRGVAAHHAGLLPAFKEVVEELFQRKLVKVVFATETLALGINMPARSVVLEKLEKFNGEARVPITPGEYTQLTGRAGRRGIDVEGHAVVQWADALDPEQVASLASKRTYPLNSSFRPTYNMAVNLIDQFGRARARQILESSFAQFQADRSVVGLAQQVRDAEDSLAGYAEAMTCDRGDFVEFASLRRELKDLEKAQRRDSSASRATRDRRIAQIQKVKKSLSRHGCQRCPEREQHARWGERYFALKRTTDKTRSQIASRTGTVARRFDRIIDVLTRLEYVRPAGDDAASSGEVELTDAGRRMKRIYGDRDLLVAEALRAGCWSGLDAASLAAIACALVYEPRRDDAGDAPLPRGAFREALGRTEQLWAEIDDLEHEHHLPGTAPLSTGLSLAMHQWARGRSLDAVLGEADMAAGDFVRWAKQTIDLLDQLGIAADGELARTARQALELVRRGIVAYSGV